MSGFRRGGCLIVIAWLMLSQSSPTSGEPFLPEQDAQVLEHLPSKAADPVARELKTLRASLSSNPQNVGVAVSLATRLIAQARSDGDPRFLGQAQATLAPWWNQPGAPPTVFLLRATIRQNAHEFDLALADLDKVLNGQPANAQAWLTKASILQVQGRYNEARRACQPLFRLASRHVALTCWGDIAALTGQAAMSLELLTTSLRRPDISVHERLWILTILAEVTARTGDVGNAEKYFKEARGLGVKDPYLLGAYADFLLDQDRPQEVITLLRRETRVDGLLLRLALAEQALHLPTSEDHAAELAARFAASRQRNTRVHMREEARFALDLLHDAHTALTLAQDNWKVQKEPWDARLLLESALAHGDRNAARPVLDWLNRNHVEDDRLQHLAAQLREERP